MPALTFQFKNYNVSINYDTLTVYPLFEKYITSEAMADCHKLKFVKNIKIPSEKHAEQRKVSEEIELKKKVRYVFFDADDHGMYHKDGFNEDNTHYHMNFYAPLTRDQLIELSDIFIKHHLITEDEKTTLLSTFDKRYADHHASLDRVLSEAKSDITQSKANLDTGLIHNFIEACSDLDLLADLHKYLLATKFDYLRVFKPTTNPSMKWKATDAKDQVVTTSSSWALIERAIKLRMAECIKTTCRYSTDLAKNRAVQLAKFHKFFSIRHGIAKDAADPNEPLSPSFLVFKEGDKEHFDSIYQAHFQAYRG